MKQMFFFAAIICGLFFYTGCTTSYYETNGLQTRNGLPNFNHKIQEKDSLSIVFLGGSITNHQGYRVQICDWLKTQYKDIRFKAINSGIGGTGSDLGVFRTDRDVLRHHPDLVFIEFAVNDAKSDSLLICHSMEGIVRKIWAQNPYTDICFLYTLNETMLDDLKAGRKYRSVRYMERIADYYDIPSVNFADDVMALMDKGELIFKGDAKKDYEDKIVFTNDGTHPTYDGGHPIYTKTLSHALLQMDKAQQKAHPLRAALYPGNYEKAKMIPISNVSRSDGWKILPKSDKAFTHFQGNPNEIQPVWESSNPNDSINICFEGSRIGVFDLIGPSSGGMSVKIDSNEPFYVRRFDKYCADRNRANYCLFETLKNEKHTVVIRPNNQRFEKSEIYQTNNKVIPESEYFNEFNTYIGCILLVGDILQ